MNEPHFPSPRPVLDKLLALDGVTDVVELLVVDEALQAISLGETRNTTFTVLEGALRQGARNAGVKNAVASVRYEIDPAACHI